MTTAKLSSPAFFIFAVVFGSGFLGSQESANAQFRVVSPNQLANVEATDVANLANFPSYRFQQVYSAEDFESLGPGPFQISRIDWRPDGEVTEPLTYSTPSWLLKLSTTPREPADLSVTFADNIGPDEQVVVDGAVTMSTDNLGPVGGPKSFDYGIDFDNPFTFDPTAGNLLMDLTVIDATGPLLLDFSFAPTDTTSFHWTGTLGHESPVAATTPESVGGPFGGHAIQFTIVPEPHTFQLLAFAIVGGSLFRRRRCRTTDWRMFDQSIRE